MTTKSVNSTKITLSQEVDVPFWSHIRRNLLFTIPMLAVGGAGLIYSHKLAAPYDLIFIVSGVILLFLAALLTFSGTWIWSVATFLFDSNHGGYNSSNQYRVSDPLGVFFKRPKRTIQSVRRK